MLSIIIVSYNTKEILLQCLENLLQIGLFEGNEIIVVDNASKDGSAEAIEKEYKEAIVVKNTTNKLFAGACNQGAEIAKGKYLLLLNSDAFPGEGQIEKLVRFMDSSSLKIACVGPRVIFPNGSLQTEGHPMLGIPLTISTFLGILKWPISDKIKGKLLPRGYHKFRYGKTRNVGWISGSCMLIRKQAWDQVGPLDERLYFYREDIEWPYRAYKMSFETWVVPESQVVHLVGASSGKEWSYNRRLKLLRGEKYFYKVTQGYTYHFINQCLMLALYPLSYLICKLLGLDFYRQVLAREMKNAINTIKIISSENI